MTPCISQIVITLPLAHIGLQVWALVIGKIVSEILASIILWIKCPWKPKFNLDFSKQKRLMQFGGYVTITLLLNWMLTQFDNFLVGKWLAIRDLGIYNTALTLVTRVFLFLIFPILPVYYARSCQFTSRNDKIDFYLNAKRILSFFVFPLIVLLVNISPFVEILILGAKWKDISFAITYLSLAGLIHLWALISGFFKSLGKPNIDTKITFINVLISLPIWLFAIQYGLKFFLISRLLTTFVFAVVNTYFEIKEIKVGILEIMMIYSKPLFATLVMAVCGIICTKLLFLNRYDLISLLCIVFVPFVVYLLSYYFIDRKTFLQLKDKVLNIFTN
ncbi:MAG: oligosaccharide flippase family protein [candidate division WOR-3 bacterium]|nr:oligosaccharide flippase family protein [candidate division WOR-3 bacterium]